MFGGEVPIDKMYRQGGGSLDWPSTGLAMGHFEEFDCADILKRSVALFWYDCFFRCGLIFAAIRFELCVDLLVQPAGRK